MKPTTRARKVPGACTPGARAPTPAERVEEIARMLGGVQITETTRSHAAEMLAAAGNPV